MTATGTGDPDILALVFARLRRESRSEQEFRAAKDRLLAMLRQRGGAGVQRHAEAAPPAPADPRDARAFADFARGTLELLRRSGMEEQAEALAESLQPALDACGWAVALGDASGRYEMRFSPRDPAVDAFSERAPVGGATINGTFYAGGRFIPTRAMAATEEKASKGDPQAQKELATLKQAKAASEAGKTKKAASLAGRGDVSPQALKGRLEKQEYAAAAGSAAQWEKDQVAASARMLHRHHGPLALHRLDEIAGALEKALAKTDDEDMRERLSRRLGLLAASVGQLTDEKRKVTGQVPPGMKPASGPGGDPAAEAASVLRRTSPESVLPLWERLKADLVAANPKHSPNWAGEIAAARITNAMRGAAQRFRQEIDARVRAGGDITDEEDALYMRMDKDASAAMRALEDASGIRAWEDMRAEPAAQEPLPPEGGAGAVPQPAPGVRVKVKEGDRDPVDVEVKAVRDGFVEIGYADSKHASTKMPAESWKHFVNDMAGKVDVPPSTDPAIEAVRTGAAKMLGRGDDGIAFRHGDDVVKMSSTVPNIPTNPGHRTPEQAAAMLRRQSEASEAMRKAGVPGVLPVRHVEHGDKAFQVRPYVDVPAKLDAGQVAEAGRIMEAMHAAGWSLNDEFQGGTRDGNLVMFDTGKASRLPDDPHKREQRLAMDRTHLEVLHRKNGVPLPETPRAVPRRSAREQLAAPAKAPPPAAETQAGASPQSKGRIAPSAKPPAPAAPAPAPQPPPRVDSDLRQPSPSGRVIPGHRPAGVAAAPAAPHAAAEASRLYEGAIVLPEAEFKAGVDAMESWPKADLLAAARGLGIGRPLPSREDALKAVRSHIEGRRGSFSFAMQAVEGTDEDMRRKKAAALEEHRAGALGGKPREQAPAYAPAQPLPPAATQPKPKAPPAPRPPKPAQKAGDLVAGLHAQALSRPVADLQAALEPLEAYSLAELQEAAGQVGMNRKFANRAEAVRLLKSHVLGRAGSYDRAHR